MYAHYPNIKTDWLFVLVARNQTASIVVAMTYSQNTHQDSQKASMEVCDLEHAAASS